MKIFGTDYDGVIINIEPQKAEAFGTILNKAWNICKEEAAKFWIATGGTSRRYKFDYFYAKQFGKQLKDEDYKTIEQEYSNVLKTQFYPTVALVPHALELLQFARSQFDYTFVSSGIPMEETRYLVNLNGISEYFDIVLGTNAIYTSKRDHFQEVIAKQKPDLFVFMADGLEDMKVAKEFSVISIGIPTNHSEEELCGAGATKVCTLSESIEFIRKLIKDQKIE